MCGPRAEAASVSRKQNCVTLRVISRGALPGRGPTESQRSDPPAGEDWEGGRERGGDTIGQFGELQ
jgi:hypothetical protein